MANKKQLFRLPDGTVAYLEMHSVKRILKDKGLAPDGYVQMFHTQNVLRRIVKYMPYQSGMTVKVTVAQTNIRKPLIVTDTPYARFLFNGKLMVSDVTGSPWARKGETKHVVTVAQTNIRKPLIVTDTPYARFLFNGKLMVSDVTGSPWARKGETKHVVSRPLDYTKTKNPKAGPFWDRALFNGKLMVSDVTGSPWARKGETKHVVSRPLDYTKTKNPKAGPFWDRALSTAEGPAMAADVQRYIRSKGG